MLIDIAFSVGYDRDAARCRQNLAAARRGVEPALRLFICRRARAPWRNLALAPVPHPGIDQTEQRAAPDLERHGRMQQQSAQGSALADRSIAVRPRPPTSQRQFAGILNDDNVASRRARGGARGRVTYHLAAGHGAIAQEAREPYLLGATSGEPPDLTAGPLDKRSVEVGPPFSRRRSPNRPSPNSLVMAPPENHRPTQGISPANVGQSRCVHPTAAFAGRGEVRRRLYFRSIPFSEEVFRAGRQSNAIALPWTGRVGSEHL